MFLNLGCCLTFDLPQPTPAIFRLNVHPARAADLEIPDFLRTSPYVPLERFNDGFGNGCIRLDAPAGRFTAWTDGVIRDPCLPDPEDHFAAEVPVSDLPVEVLPFLLPSRFCESDVLSEAAWALFGGVWPGWNRVQAICNYVHLNTAFSYPFARATRTAVETHSERCGVCRDYAHLAIAFCRALNIPARYCTGYISDVGRPPPYPPMDFAAWIEVYLGDQWWTFDPRNNDCRRGRVLVARGRDAADVPLTHTFGRHALLEFRVWINEAELLALARSA